jgi:hypothetical protein
LKLSLPLIEFTDSAWKIKVVSGSVKSFSGRQNVHAIHALNASTEIMMIGTISISFLIERIPENLNTLHESRLPILPMLFNSHPSLPSKTISLNISARALDALAEEFIQQYNLNEDQTKYNFSAQ